MMPEKSRLDTGPPYDARAVANLMLDQASALGIELTNLVLQKLLYFAHGHHLIRYHAPLLTGHFEAWTYGPVHPGVYQAFRSEADRPVRIRAHARNVMSGLTRPLAVPAHPRTHEIVQYVLSTFGRLPAGRLIDIAHAPGGPWHYVKNKAETSIALGLRIPDSVTIERFRFQKVSVGPRSAAGEPSEDTPLV